MSARVYRNDLRCPHCGSNWMPKDGTSQGRRVYHRSDCGRQADGFARQTARKEPLAGALTGYCIPYPTLL